MDFALTMELLAVASTDLFGLCWRRTWPSSLTHGTTLAKPVRPRKLKGEKIRNHQNPQGSPDGNVSLTACKSPQQDIRGSRAKAQRRKVWVPSIHSLPLRLGGFAREYLLPPVNDLVREWMQSDVGISCQLHSAAYHSIAILSLTERSYPPMTDA